MTPRGTPRKAVSGGFRTVTSVVMLMMFGPPVIAGLVFWLVGREDIGGLIACILVIPSWIGAWLAWSILTPRWRIWAYERVDDLDDLKAQAVTAGLIWPDGHFFERTEIRSPDQRQRIKQLEDAHLRR